MTVFALIDGNNFFVSCERAFNPALWGQPVVVLSNNDGCIIARSPEAKALGIQMAQPYFSAKGLIIQHRVRVLSANLELYRNMHYRMISLLRDVSPDLEVYSIDEAFFYFSTLRNTQAMGRQIKDTLRQGLGLPVSIGFGRTKTLAKAANYFAKRVPFYQNILDLSDPRKARVSLRHLPIQEVWGIGRRHSTKLERLGIKTALAFADLPATWVRQRMTVTGLRVHQELNGCPCHTLESENPQKQSRLVSRSFAHPLTEPEEIRKSLAFFIARGAEKLRAERQKTSHVRVFLTTKRYTRGPHYRGDYGISLPEPTHNTALLTRAAYCAFNRIYRSGFAFKKAGIALSYLSEDTPQGRLWSSVPSPHPSDSVIASIDRLNTRLGRDAVYFGAQGLEQHWRPIPAFLSPRYTTDINEIPSCS